MYSHIMAKRSGLDAKYTQQARSPKYTTRVTAGSLLFQLDARHGTSDLFEPMYRSGRPEKHLLISC